MRCSVPRVWCYARAMRCPVLPYAVRCGTDIGSPASVCGTDIGNTRLPLCTIRVALCAIDMALCAIRMALCGVRYGDSLCCYALLSAVSAVLR
eukprot:3639935-Rhodomonas_salina.2